MKALKAVLTMLIVVLLLTSASPVKSQETKPDQLHGVLIYVLLDTDGDDIGDQQVGSGVVVSVLGATPYQETKTGQDSYASFALYEGIHFATAFPPNPPFRRWECGRHFTVTKQQDQKYWLHCKLRWALWMPNLFS